MTDDVSVGILTKGRVVIRQQPFHAVNQVGTMRFTSKDVVPVSSQDEK